MSTPPIFPEQLYLDSCPNNMWLDVDPVGNFTLSPKKESWFGRAKRFFTFEQNPAILRVLDRFLDLQDQLEKSEGADFSRLKGELRTKGDSRCWRLVIRLTNLTGKRIGLPNALSRLILKVVNFFRHCFGKEPIVLRNVSEISPTDLLSVFKPTTQDIASCPFQGELVNPINESRQSVFKQEIYQAQCGLKDSPAALLYVWKPAAPQQIHGVEKPGISPAAELGIAYNKESSQFEMVCKIVEGTSPFQIQIKIPTYHESYFDVTPAAEVRIPINLGVQYTCSFTDQDLCELSQNHREATFQISLRPLP